MFESDPFHVRRCLPHRLHRYMIAKETTNVESSADVSAAFAQASGGKPYITKNELYGALSEEQAS